jgi:hypothetical protein
VINDTKMRVQLETRQTYRLVMDTIQNCLCIHETTEHLLTECNYTEAVWNLIALRFGVPDYISMAAAGGPVQWVKCLLKLGSKKEKKRKLGILFICWWMLWKERNRRIFEDKELAAGRLAGLMQEEITLQLSVLGSAQSVQNSPSPED